MFKITLLLSSVFIVSCTTSPVTNSKKAQLEKNLNSQMTKDTKNMKLPKANLEHEGVENRSEIVGWGDKKPIAPKGFEVILFAKGLKHPRRILELPNGDILVAESDDPSKSADQIRLLRDKDGDGVAEEKHVLLKDFKQPYGMAYIKGKLYVSGVDALKVYNYKLGSNKISSKAKQLLYLPAGGYNHHWTRNLIVAKDKKHLYISVGSSSNVGEHGMDKEVRRANILKVKLNGTSEEVFAAGLRNPVGMSFSSKGDLWTVVNERDNIGDDLVPDYLTKVKKDGFYGWPYSYYGQNADPRRADERDDLIEKALVPDVALGAHTASLGLSFYDKKSFPKFYHNGAFIGQHGSWNRKVLSGYQVAFVPFKKGKPSDDPKAFLTGFVADRDQSKVYGRPVGVEVIRTGDLLVADDASNRIWLVRKK